jgi:adenine-specific DNA-methyltransferase
MVKITSEHPESKSLDILANNIEKLKEIFPEVVSENRVDFEKLQLLLNDAITPKDDLYGLNWWGKTEAIREAMKPSLGTLRPCKEESVNWDSTENLYIEGDNLEVLKLLQKSYNGKVKMIYIDPPYNTGKDFVYKDNFKDTLKNYLTQTGQIDDEDVKQSTNTKDDGRYHSNWLNMMYPRLKLARNLLTDDGVIFISIDDNEVDNLRKICDEIFGEVNFMGCIMWNSTKSVTNTALISVSHNYNLVFAKNIDYFIKNRQHFRLPESGDGFSNPDNDARGPWKADPFQVGGWRPNQQYEIINPKTGEKYLPNSGSSWKNDFDKFQTLINDNRIVFGVSGEAGPQRKRFLSEALDRGKVTKTWWDDVGATTNGTTLVKNLFNNSSVFTNPKPVDLIEKMIQLGDHTKNGIILDFFGGSSTTAHSIFNINENITRNNKFILVQLPELTDENSEAFKAGFKTITEIGKERIRRAGNKILTDKKEALKVLQNKMILSEEEQTEKEKLEQVVEKLDIGFKVFKLDSSNIEAWDTEMPVNTDEIKQKLENSLFNIKEDRKEDDLLYEFLLKQGHLLTAPIEEKKYGNATIYSVNQGELFVCLADKITNELVTTIGEWAKEYISRSVVDLKPVLILKDSAFEANDSIKTNTELTLCNQFGFAKINTI